AHQSAGQREFSLFVHCRDAVPCRQCDDVLTPAVEEWVCGNEERTSSQISHGLERGIEFTFGCGGFDIECVCNIRGGVQGVFFCFSIMWGFIYFYSCVHGPRGRLP